MTRYTIADARRCTVVIERKQARCQKPVKELRDGTPSRHCHWHWTEPEKRRNQELWAQERQEVYERWLAAQAARNTAQARESEYHGLAYYGRMVAVEFMQDKPEPCWKCRRERRHHYQPCCE